MLENDVIKPNNSGKIATKIKMLYGLGFSSRGIKDGLFQVFLFLYFNQVLGLSTSLIGLAAGIALVFDAVSDPVVGILSDKYKSGKWGRRHPFMFLSALPLGIFTYLLFLPPDGLSEMQLFTWLLVFTILLRLALTFFVVPHMSFGAEMSTDYEERTSITSYRIMFSAIITTVTIIIGFLVFFSEASGGLNNAEGYPQFALFCAVVMVLVIWICVWGTRSIIPSLPTASDTQQHASLGEIFQGMKVAVKMRSFSSLVSFIMVVYAGIGIGVVLTTYFVTYYFELTTTQFAVLPISTAVGGLISVFAAKWFNTKFDKKKGAIISTILFSLFFNLPFNLRLLGLFPDNGEPNLLLFYTILLTFAYTFFWVTLSLANSMMADVVDEYELHSGDRQEGLFFAAMSFAFKCSTGLGWLFAGILLSMINFPEKAVVGEIPADALYGLGVIGGPVLTVIYMGATLLLLSYPINKARYQEIRDRLDA